MPARITGLASTVSGRNGSGARRSHHTNASSQARASRDQREIVGESQGTRVPPEVSASSNRVAAAIIERGADDVEPVRPVMARQPLHRAMREQRRERPSGTLSQKITDQCR